MVYYIAYILSMILGSNSMTQIIYYILHKYNVKMIIGYYSMLHREMYTTIISTVLL